MVSSILQHRRKAFRGGGGGSTLLTNLWAWYEMAETTNTDNAIDASGNGRTWTKQVNMTPDATGAPDGGACRTAISNAVSMGRAQENLSNSNAVSVGIWIYFTGTTWTATSFTFDNTSSLTNFYNLGFFVRTTTQARLFLNGAFTTVSYPAFTANAWHCFVYTFDRSGSGTSTLYVDGTAATGTATGLPATTTVGNYKIQTGVSGNKFTTIAVWDKLLSSDEITEFYNAGVNLRHANL
jgi:hypothetical protein